MSFGDSINALLDTYANCISLLKAFRHSARESGSSGAPNQQANLRKSLKSDRSLVERAYSSKLSESGSRFRKGDARAVSAVDRILAKLRSAIANLLRLSGKQKGLDLDYESLMTLSKASRVEAIKAIDRLSRRLASPSRSSVVSSSLSSASSSKTSPKAPSSSRRNKKRLSSSSSAGVSSSSNKSSNKAGRPSANRPPKTKTAPTTRGEKTAAPTSSQPRPGPSERLRKTPRSPPNKPAELEPSQPQSRVTRTASEEKVPQRMREATTTAAAAAATVKVANRISILSFSSGSTKLGEIPPRKLRSAAAALAANGPDGEGYNVRPVFPLSRPYTVVEEVRERRFWGLFGRRREG